MALTPRCCQEQGGCNRTGLHWKSQGLWTTPACPAPLQGVAEAAGPPWPAPAGQPQPECSCAPWSWGQCGKQPLVQGVWAMGSSVPGCFSWPCAAHRLLFPLSATEAPIHHPGAGPVVSVPQFGWGPLHRYKQQPDVGQGKTALGMRQHFPSRPQALSHGQPQGSCCWKGLTLCRRDPA